MVWRYKRKEWKAALECSDIVNNRWLQREQKHNMRNNLLIYCSQPLFQLPLYLANLAGWDVVAPHADKTLVRPFLARKVGHVYREVIARLPSHRPADSFHVFPGKRASDLFFGWMRSFEKKQQLAKLLNPS